MFEKCLTAFSCSFGTQIDGFADPLSDNIVSSKPIIKINDHIFFVSRVELDRRLDKILESLLEAEKQHEPKAWNRFLTLRSKYLEDAVHKCFAKMFPSQVYRNAYFTFQGKDYETDLLVIHGNKILIVESKSGSLPLSIGRGSMRSLKERLTKLVKYVWTQGTNTKKYINLHGEVTFWKDKNKNSLLVKVDSSKTNYKFFVIGVTLAHMGDLVANLKNIQAFNFFPGEEYPWMVYLYDLDVIADRLSTPEFIHYMEQRMRVQEKNIFVKSELILLGYYKTHGHLNPPLLDGKKANINIFSDDYMSMFDEYYTNPQSYG